ncbi:MAG: hypothetical protein ACR2LJ_04955 [Acidimicrobiales bacterium]
MTTRVFLLDDHELVRRGVRDLRTEAAAYAATLAERRRANP